MKFAKEGYPFIAIGLLMSVATWLKATTLGQWSTIPAISLTILTIFVAWFFRDPSRTAPSGEDFAISPADGKIISIREIDEPSFFGGSCQRISIFLSIFNVHVQRAPMAGKVTHRNYRSGKYLAAWNDKASEENEQSSLGISTKNGNILVRQIAGLIARRIATYPELNSNLEVGERIGLIRFGSRVDLFIPSHWNIECSVGDTSKGGSTILARSTPLAN
ncbi:MAG TPA: phosphatidylserine decarboxylase family protein [Gemmatimonadetes bacterium]|jgi:phosphatidylserine decarboxylase|nr:phosphatidylserine decarboxylase family protein [Gemmatimonadota bacterium]